MGILTLRLGFNQALLDRLWSVSWKNRIHLDFVSVDSLKITSMQCCDV